MRCHQDFTSSNVVETIRQIAHLLDSRLITQQDISEKLDIEKSKLSRWLNGVSSWSSIGAENYGRIREFLAAKDVELDLRMGEAGTMSRDPTFHGMARFLGIDEKALEAARHNLVGSYVAWRYSYFAPPHILMGKVDIEFEEETGALRTSEHFRVPEGWMGAFCPEINFQREGYIWPTRQNMYVMMSQKVGFLDVQTAYLNKSMHNAITLERDAMHTVEGVILDWQGPDLYMTKVLLQKLKRPLPLAEIGLKREEELEQAVLVKLKERFIGPHFYLRVYK